MREKVNQSQTLVDSGDGTYGQAEGNTERRDSASAWMALRGLNDKPKVAEVDFWSSGAESVSGCCGARASSPGRDDLTNCRLDKRGK
jgi:hypothetical protein